jgi:hypothetical protein
MNLKYEKSAADYQNLCEIEKVRKKLNTNGKQYEKFIAVQNGTIYCTNGFYMLAVKAESIADGVYQIIKGKNEVVLITDDDNTSFPKCTEIEQLCPEYGEAEQLKIQGDNVSVPYCHVIKSMGDDILDINIFEPLYNTKFFEFFRICKGENMHKPVVLADSESESTKRAYIMGMVF